jgi:ZIP family zinc transporter
MQLIADWFLSIPPVWQALLAGLFTWGVTAVGASMVFLTHSVNRRLLDSMLGFSAGVMLAASYWSLLAPAIEISRHGPLPAWLPVLIGFLLGGGTLWLFDRVLPHLHLGLPVEQAEGPRTSFRRSTLLVTAITLHNIPEGLAVGVGFGGVLGGNEASSPSAAIALAIGIGLQNFPEGVAVAMPLRAEGLSRLKSFWYGQLSGLVEPVAAVVGCAAVMLAAPLLPYALAFAAGAMLFVVAEELIPEAHQHGNVDLATLSLLVGFALMMVLDVALSQ